MNVSSTLGGVFAEEGLRRGVLDRREVVLVVTVLDAEPPGTQRAVERCDRARERRVRACLQRAPR